MDHATEKNIAAYTKVDYVKVELILYVRAPDELLDLDNMAKLVGDALQGNKTGQRMKAHHKKRLLPNDKRILLWKMEKRVSGARIEHKSRLLVQRYKPSWRTRTGAARDHVL